MTAPAAEFTSNPFWMLAGPLAVHTCSSPAPRSMHRPQMQPARRPGGLTRRPSPAALPTSLMQRSTVPVTACRAVSSSCSALMLAARSVSAAA